MEQEKSNVQAFNKRVQDIKAALLARSAPVPDLLIALFNGYLSCGNHAFMEVIKRKQNEYEEDKGSTLASEQLMQMARSREIQGDCWPRRVDAEERRAVGHDRHARDHHGTPGAAQTECCPSQQQGQEDPWKGCHTHPSRKTTGVNTSG
jgi:hypothetical protein